MGHSYAVQELYEQPLALHAHSYVVVVVVEELHDTAGVGPAEENSFEHADVPDVSVRSVHYVPVDDGEDKSSVADQ